MLTIEIQNNFLSQSNKQQINQMNVKKFAQDKAKKIKYEKFLKSNKQNLCSVDDSKFKQFSVDLHKLSLDQDYPNRNIIKEDISIFLENQSQNKTFHDKNLLQLELKKFTKKLDEDVGSVRQFLDAELQQKDDIRAQQIRKLIGVLVRKLQKDTSRYGSINESVSQSRSKYSSKNVLNETMITPYLKDEVETLQRKLAELQEQSKEYRQFQQIEKAQKQYIKHTLMTVYNQQLQQVSQLQQFGNVPAF